MELVYLWVEEYKNIKKQGFNFSPRFNCKYDDETKELNITDREETGEYYPKNFFGENINITAIVGENGSGKSSVLTGITNHKILFKKNGKFHSNNSQFKSEFYLFDKTDDYEIIYLEYDLIKINPIRTPFEWFNLPIYNKNLYLKIENNSVGSTDFNITKFRENFFNLIIEHVESFQLDLFNFNPFKIILSDHLSEVDSERFTHINNLIKELKDENFSKENFLTFLYSTITSIVSLKIKKVEKIKDLESIENDILEHYNSNFDPKIDNISKIYSFFEVISANEQSREILIEKFIPIYKEYKDVFLKLIEIGYLQINFKDTKKREYFDLSQGERKFFTESLMIYDAIYKAKKDDIFLVLDEPDLTLHPDWQKKYINELTKLISNFSEKNFHIIITSHSPFILSDLPKENVIFLKNGKQVNVDIDTFGANIHTLLSHGFFMENGLMGEFAKEKINKAIEYLNKISPSKEEIDYCENIISIIGEPILKRQLQKMLDSKRLKKVDKIDDIEKQIVELSQELEKLKNGQN